MTTASASRAAAAAALPQLLRKISACNTQDDTAAAALVELTEMLNNRDVAASDVIRQPKGAAALVVLLRMPLRGDVSMAEVAAVSIGQLAERGTPPPLRLAGQAALLQAGAVPELVRLLRQAEATPAARRQLLAAAAKALNALTFGSAAGAAAVFAAPGAGPAIAAAIEQTRDWDAASDASMVLSSLAQAASPKAGVMRPSVRPLMKLLQPGGEAPHRNQGLAAITLSLFTQLPELVAEMTAADGVALCAQLVGMRSHYNVAACAALTLAKIVEADAVAAKAVLRHKTLVRSLVAQLRRAPPPGSRNDPAVQATVCIGSLATKGSEYQDAIMAEKPMPGLVGVLSRDTNLAGPAAADTIGDLCNYGAGLPVATGPGIYVPPSGAVAAQRAALAAGAVPKVVALLQLPASAFAQSSAPANMVRALGIMCRGVTPARDAAVAARALPLVIAMLGHPGLSERHDAAFCLGSLLTAAEEWTEKGREVAAKALAAGAARPLAALMAAGCDQPSNYGQKTPGETARLATASVYQLAVSGPEAPPKLAACVAPLVGLLPQVGSQPAGFRGEVALAAVYLLSNCPANQERFVAAGGLPVMARLLLSDQIGASIIDAAAVMAILARGGRAHRDAIIACGGLLGLIKIVRNPAVRAAHVAAVESAVEGILDLCRGNTGCQEAVRGLGGITGLVTVARCTSTDMDDLCAAKKAIITLMFLAEESDLNREAIAKAGAADAIAETVDYFAARKAQLCMQYGHIAPTAEAALAKLQDLSELMASCEVLD